MGEPVYLKDSSWLQYNPPSDCGWYWRKICSVKDTISGGFVEAVPKHTFIAWIISHQALKLKDKLVQYGVCVDDFCCICQMHSETHQHLFTSCQFTQELLYIVGNLLGTDIRADGCLLTFARRRWIKLRKSVTIAAVIACWYFIWMQRNEARLHLCITRPSIVASHVQEVNETDGICVAKMNWE
ncbi:uncharacterized protein LOC141628627 [Silene latifolia]|uniref:uncharacterized protein LOC141628627 n=1 Tax=Silene latifolia TaxID=37657 RepID=UPI003D76A852